MQNNRIDLNQEQNIQQWEKIVVISMIVIAFLTLWVSLYAPINDGDIWFHLLYGKAILDNHTLTPDHSIYSWTPSSNNNIYCAWIGQVIYFLLYKYFGNGGVIVLRYLAASTLFIAIILLSRERNTFYNPITWFVALLCTLVISQVALDKPEILSFAFMVLIVWNWYKIKQIKKNVLYHVYFFPVLTLFWVNTHGAFVFGCLFLFCVGLGETINHFFYQQNSLPRKTYYHLLSALLLSAGSTLITPYGYDYLYQIIMQYVDKQRLGDIGQIQAYYRTFTLPNNPQLSIFANTATCMILLVFSMSFYKKQLDFVPIISNLLFAFLFTLYGRMILPWVAVFSLSVVYYGSAVSIVRTNRKIIFLSTFALATFFLTGWFLHHEKQYPSRGQWLEFGVSESFAIDEEIDFIKANYKGARIGNTYDHGTYILWNNWPQMEVMIDARYFPYMSWINEYVAFHKGLNVENFIKRNPFDVIAVKHNLSALIFWFHNSTDWKLVFYGKSAAVFAHSSLALPDRFKRGANINNINSFSIAADVFLTSILFRDWQGAESILNTMKRNFTHSYQVKIITGLEDIKLSAHMYEQKKYSASVRFMEQALEKKTIDDRLYAAALLMKAIENWQDKQWNAAIKNTITSLLVKDTFAAKYNLALMVWQMVIIGQNQQSLQLALTNQEQAIAANWRNIFASLIKNKNKYQHKYVNYIENASKILNGDKDCQTQLVSPDY